MRSSNSDQFSQSPDFKMKPCLLMASISPKVGLKAMMLQIPPAGQLSAPSIQCIFIFANGLDLTFPLSLLRIAPNHSETGLRPNKLLRTKHHLSYCYYLLSEKHYQYACCFTLLSWLFRSLFVLRQEKMFRFSQILSPPLCSLATNIAFMGMCMQTGA